VLVLTNGGALAIDKLVAHPSPDTPYAIVEAFNPSVAGAGPLAEALFGKTNKWGKLPVTMYPASFVNEKAMTDYDMASGVGRTYKYYTGRPLFEFGFGLSLTTFALSCEQTASATAREVAVTCAVRNTGDRYGDEVVMAFHAVGDTIRAKLDHPAPKRSLVDFARLSVPAGGKVTQSFTFRPETFALVGKDGWKTIAGGQHTLTFSRGVGDPSDDVKIVIDVPGAL